MQIVIDIPKKIYDHILRTNMLVNSDRLEVTEAIISGTPLPKEHGDYEPSRKGHWIDTKMKQEYYAEEYKCSECGNNNHFSEFCPNCGAKMTDNETKAK